MQRQQAGKRKNGPVLWISLLILVLLAVSSTGYYFWGKQRDVKQVKQTVDSYTAALEKQDYETISQLVSPSSLKKLGYTKEQLAERYQTIYGGIKASAIKVTTTETEKESADEYRTDYSVEMTTALGKLKDQQFTAFLKKADDGYQIEWKPSMLFPDLKAEETVSISTTQGKRGNLLSSDGKPLAKEGLAWQVGLQSSKLGSGDKRKQNIRAVSEAFDIAVEQLEKELSANWVTEDSFVPFTVIREEDEKPQLNGVLYQETTIRTYPLNEAAAHLIGYVGKATAEDIEKTPDLPVGEVIGKTGLEKQFDQQLRGEKGGHISIKDKEGNEKTVIQEKAVKNGKDITLTINTAVQQSAFDHLNGKKGSVVVTNPTNGELLAVVSSPSFDANKMTSGISTEDYRSYQSNPDSPFLTRYSARYAPGSTFKTITGALALDAGTLKPEDTSKVNGLKWQKDKSWGDYYVTRVADVPSVNLEQAYVYSDNIYFAKAALNMGEKTFLEGLNQFIFGEKMDLPIAMKPAQISNDGKLSSDGLLADTGFGQGQLLMSPIQQAASYSVFANEGKLVYPKLTKNQETTDEKQVVTPESANIVKKDMIQVVKNNNGSAHKLADLNSPIAAKTGTAETKQLKNGNKETNGFLLAFNSEDSRYLMLALMEEGSSGDVVTAMKPFLEDIDKMVEK